MTRLFLTAIFTAFAIAHAQTPKLFVDSDRTELLHAAPELTALEFTSDQTPLDPLLRSTGQQLKSMFATFVNVSLAEEIHEMHFESAQLLWAEQHETFRYIARVRPFAERREQTKDGPAPRPQLVHNGFLVAGRFIEMLNDLLPENQKEQRFRYLGRVVENGSPLLVVAFTARDESRQGLVWMDESTKRIVRLRTDTLKNPETASLQSLTRDVRFVPVNFAALAATCWLPAYAAVHIRFPAGELYSIHRFSDYHVDGFEEDTDAAQLKEDTGEAAVSPTPAEDALETLLKGMTAVQAKKPADAVAPLRDAAARLPERFEPGYYLGLALRGTLDFTGAEAQFRESLRHNPNFAPAHNELGTILFSRGDTAGALAEFQEAARLQPENLTIRSNLDSAKKQLEVAKVRSPAPAPSDVTIKVDVRQVLVPVVVTDKEGHHVTGLKQADFKILEDGVEQKISAFASERADISTPSAPSGSPEATQQPAAAIEGKPLPARHAYVICVDGMHASFGNFVHVREALQKLFQQEEKGDSQYVVIGLGRSMSIVQNTTSDPKVVLETLGSPSFRKLFLASQQSSAQDDLTHFERTLQEVRTECDSPDLPDQMQCKSQKPQLPFAADRISESTRISIIQFLSQLRSVVDQLAAGRGRRTLVLISDGFLLTPGRASYALLEAYFPDLHSTRGYERMQDVMDPIYKLAAKGNVPIYTVDSRGLYTSPSFDASRGGVSASAAPAVSRALDDIATDEGSTLLEIAAATGGTAFHNSNDLLAGLKRAFADGREYYMLAYVPSNETQDGKFRKIEVQVTQKKVIVQAKRGYWATPP